MSQVTTIQLTGKRIKAARAIGWLLFFISVAMLFDNFGKDAQALGGVLFWISVLIVLGARISKWWNHE
jgi:hypothetical protein